MAWTEPKTDWNVEYRGDYEDINRITGNIAYLKELASELFHEVTEISFGSQKTVTSMFYAREMNYIEETLDTLNLETYGLGIGEKQIYKTNGSTPLWSEFNRIESASLLLYNTLRAHKNSLPSLSITLGGEKGIKV